MEKMNLKRLYTLPLGFAEKWAATTIESVLGALDEYKLFHKNVKTMEFYCKTEGGNNHEAGPSAPSGSEHKDAQAPIGSIWELFDEDSAPKTKCVKLEPTSPGTGKWWDPIDLMYYL